MKNTIDKKFSEKIIIGLVGTSGSGKNVVAKYFENYDVSIIDADIISNEVLLQNQKTIIQNFKNINSKIENTDGTLNKSEFASILFSDSKLLKQHEAFMFPIIEKKILKVINEGKKIILLNAPTLHKTKLIKCVNFFIYVTANYFLRLIRVQKRDHLSLCNIILRFKNQNSFFQEYKKTNKKIYTIKNNFSKRSLYKKLNYILNDIKNLS